MLGSRRGWAWVQHRGVTSLGCVVSLMASYPPRSMASATVARARSLRRKSTPEVEIGIAPQQFDCQSSPTRPIGAFSPDRFVPTEAVLAMSPRLVEAGRLSPLLGPLLESLQGIVPLAGPRSRAIELGRSPV